MGDLTITKDQIDQTLVSVRQFVLSDGGDLEVVAIDGFKVQIRLKGACISCPLSFYTVQFGIQKALRDQISEKIIVEVVD